MIVNRDPKARGPFTAFAEVAGAYERGRPEYPEDAVRWLAGDEPHDVVDLGAGTGKLTRALVALGHRVTAVEPLDADACAARGGGPGSDGREGQRRVDARRERVRGRRHLRAVLPLVRPRGRAPRDRARPPPGRLPGARLELAGRPRAVGRGAIGDHRERDRRAPPTSACRSTRAVSSSRSRQPTSGSSRHSTARRCSTSSSRGATARSSQSPNASRSCKRSHVSTTRPRARRACASRT